MTKILTNLSARRFSPYLPYLVAGIGFFLSFLICYGLMFQCSASFIAQLDKSLPWIILTLGLSLSAVLAVLVRLIQLKNQSTQSLSIVNKDFEKQSQEHFRSEEIKQKLERALLQGQKLQAIGTLAGGIAHDFNNLLYAIIGYVELAREDVEKESLVYTNLGKVLEASHRGQELISRILTFSRRQRHDFKPIKLQTMIENILSLLRPTVPASVTIIFQTMKEDCTILADQTQLHQIIVNIINNAVDAMDGEGIITLKVQYVTAQDELLKQFPNIALVDYCKIEIIDTGHGMDPTTIERIFEPFFTTKEVGKGTGLGLATAHAIIKEHHGEIMVNSELGHGTTFTLLIPEYKEKTDG